MNRPSWPNIWNSPSPKIVVSPPCNRGIHIKRSERREKASGVLMGEQAATLIGSRPNGDLAADGGRSRAEIMHVGLMGAHRNAAHPRTPSCERATRCSRAAKTQDKVAAVGAVWEVSRLHWAWLRDRRRDSLVFTDRPGDDHKAPRWYRGDDEQQGS